MALSWVWRAERGNCRASSRSVAPNLCSRRMLSRSLQPNRARISLRPSHSRLSCFLKTSSIVSRRSNHSGWRAMVTVYMIWQCSVTSCPQYPMIILVIDGIMHHGSVLLLRRDRSGPRRSLPALLRAAAELPPALRRIKRGDPRARPPHLSGLRGRAAAACAPPAAGQQRARVAGHPLRRLPCPAAPARCFARLDPGAARAPVGRTSPRRSVAVAVSGHAMMDVDPETWRRLQRLVLDSVTSQHSRRAYETALEAFRDWCTGQGIAGFTKATVQAWRAALEAARLAPSTINVRLSAVRKLASEAADNHLLAPEVAAAITRVRGARHLGEKTGNWLSREQAERLLELPDRSTRKGLRDRALLALLVGCGLRREELAGLEIERIQQREGRWCIVDLAGKGKRIRTVDRKSTCL